MDKYTETKKLISEIDIKSEKLKNKILNSKSKYTVKGNAQVTNTQRLSAAKAEVATFLASVESNSAHGDAYTYQKRLNAVREAYKKANLVILGNGVKESMLYFGSVVGNEKAE